VSLSWFCGRQFAALHADVACWFALVEVPAINRQAAK